MKSQEEPRDGITSCFYHSVNNKKCLCAGIKGARNHFLGGFQLAKEHIAFKDYQLPLSKSSLSSSLTYTEIHNTVCFSGSVSIKTPFGLQ